MAELTPAELAQARASVAAELAELDALIGTVEVWYTTSPTSFSAELTLNALYARREQLAEESAGYATPLPPGVASEGGPQ